MVGGVSGLVTQESGGPCTTKDTYAMYNVALQGLKTS